MENSTHPSPEVKSSNETLESIVLAERRPFPIHGRVEEEAILPLCYGMDRLQLMVQSPFRVFAYWEVTMEHLQKELRLFPVDEHHSFRLMLQWIEDGQEQFQTYDSGAVSEWWFETRPDTRYRARLCLYSEDFGTISVLDSNEIRTPCDAVDEAEQEIEGGNETAELLTQLVELTGLKGKQEERKESVPMHFDLPVGGLTLPKPKSDSEHKKVEVEPTRPTSFCW